MLVQYVVADSYDHGELDFASEWIGQQIIEASVKSVFTVVLIQEKLDGITRTFKLELSPHFFEPVLFCFVYALGH
jgi:hypothetical protein